MKWDNDPLKYEKYLLLDGIIKFAESVGEENLSNIRLRTLYDFIDYFVDSRNENHKP